MKDLNLSLGLPLFVLILSAIRRRSISVNLFIFPPEGVPSPVEKFSTELKEIVRLTEPGHFVLGPIRKPLSYW